MKWVLTTANAARTNGLTWLSKHGGAQDNKFSSPIRWAIFAKLPRSHERIDRVAIGLHNKIANTKKMETINVIQMNRTPIHYWIVIASVRNIFIFAEHKGNNNKQFDSELLDTLPTPSKYKRGQIKYTVHGLLHIEQTRADAEIEIPIQSRNIVDENTYVQVLRCQIVPDTTRLFCTTSWDNTLNKDFTNGLVLNGSNVRTYVLVSMVAFRVSKS
jgi:hypothetical protein